jgi:hypothetical protein
MIPNDGMVPAEFHIWGVIKLGRHKNGTQYTKTILDRGFSIDVPSKAVLQSSNFSCTREETEIDLVVLPTSFFFGENIITRRELHEKAQKLYGLLTCPPEVGPALRLAHRHQNKDEILYVEMDPIFVPLTDRDPDKCHLSFVVVSMRSNGHHSSWLRSWDGRGGHAYRPEDLHVFMRPRPK